jgi:hypothetical protein
MEKNADGKPTICTVIPQFLGFIYRRDTQHSSVRLRDRDAADPRNGEPESLAKCSGGLGDPPFISKTPDSQRKIARIGWWDQARMAIADEAQEVFQADKHLIAIQLRQPPIPLAGGDEGNHIAAGIEGLEICPSPRLVGQHLSERDATLGEFSE